MFKNDYQGGRYFQVFSAQGKDPTSAWKLAGGSGIRKIYESEVKSYVYSLEGNVSTTKMQLPRDFKQSLTLVQRYIVFQLNVSKGAEFMIEIGLTDVLNNKRRLNLSTSTKEVNVTPLHAKLPLNILKKSVWINCCIDLVNITSDVWPGQTFSKTDNLSISANSKIRRIFTMKSQPHDTTDDHEIYGQAIDNNTEMDSVPSQVQLNSDVLQFTQIINMYKIRSLDIRSRGDKPNVIDLDLSASGRRSQNPDNSFHIAFGTKIGKPPTAGPRKSSSSALPSSRDQYSSKASAGSIRNSRDFVSPLLHPVSAHPIGRNSEIRTNEKTHNRQRLSSDPGNRANTGHPTHHTSIPINDALNQSRSWSGTEMQQQKNSENSLIIKPHPPSGDAAPANRRRPKVRSGDIQSRTAADAHFQPSNIPVPIRKHHDNSGSLTSIENNDGLKSHTSALSPPLSSRRVKLTPLNRNGINGTVAEGGHADLSKGKALHPIENRLAHRGLRTNRNNSNNETESHKRVISIPQPNKDYTERQDEVSDVINILKQKTDHMEPVHSVDLSLGTSADWPPSYHEEEDEDMLIDSLDKFRAGDYGNGAVSSEDRDESSDEDEGLFLFRSPPKALHIPETSPDVKSGGGTVKKNLLSQIDGVSFIKSQRDIYDSSNYTSVPTNNYNRAQLEPRPPDSPRVSPQPRVRSKPPSLVNSNKVTPESSGNADDLRNGLLVNGHAVVPSIRSSQDEITPKTNDDSPGSSGGRKDLRAGLRKEPLRKNNLDVDALPSPRASVKEPRVSSAKRTNSAGSNRGDSRNSDRQDDDMVALTQSVQLLRNSTRSPSSSRGSTRLSRKSVREIPESDKRLINAPYSTQSPLTSLKHLEPIKSYEPIKYKRMNESHDEQVMLEFLKREQEMGGSIREDMNETRTSDKNRQYEHEVIHSDGEHSSDESFATTSVPANVSHDYKAEMMDTLEDGSDSRGHSVFSPPVTLPGRQSGDRTGIIASQLVDSLEQLDNNHNKSYGKQRSVKAGTHSDSEDDLLDLIYDPELNCYYDPNTHKYYELV